MSVQFAAASTGGGIVSSGANQILTFAHTVGGADRYLVVGVIGNAGSLSIDGVTYNGDPLTLLVDSSDSNDLSQIWGILAPDTGTHNVVVQYDSNGSTRLECGAISFTGVDQLDPVGTVGAASGSGTAPSVVVSSEVGGMVVDCVWLGITDWVKTAGPGQTSRCELARLAMSTEPGAASVTMSWTSSSSWTWRIVAVPLNGVGVVENLAGTSDGAGDDLGALSLAASLAGASAGAGGDLGALSLSGSVALAGASDGAADDLANLTVGALFLAGASDGAGDDLGALSLSGSVFLTGASDGAADDLGALSLSGTVFLAGASDGAADDLAALALGALFLAGASDGAGGDLGALSLSGTVFLAGASDGAGDDLGALSLSFHVGDIGGRLGVAPGLTGRLGAGGALGPRGRLGIGVGPEGRIG